MTIRYVNIVLHKELCLTRHKGFSAVHINLSYQTLFKRKPTSFVFHGEVHIDKTLVIYRRQLHKCFEITDNLCMKACVKKTA